MEVIGVTSGREPSVVRPEDSRLLLEMVPAKLPNPTLSLLIIRAVPSGSLNVWLQMFNV